MNAINDPNDESERLRQAIRQAAERTQRLENSLKSLPGAELKQ